MYQQHAGRYRPNIPMDGGISRRFAAIAAEFGLLRSNSTGQGQCQSGQRVIGTQFRNICGSCDVFLNARRLHRIASGQNSGFRNLLTIFALSFAILIALVEFANANGRGDLCVDGETIGVQISQQLLVVPLGYKPFIYDGDRNSIGIQRCSSEMQHRVDQPVEISSLYFRTHHDQVSQDENTRSIYGVQISIWESSQSSVSSRLVLDRLRAQLAEVDLTTEDLPRVIDFFAFDPFDNTPPRFQFYISVPGGVLSPDGYPLVFQCQPPGDRNFPSIDGPGEPCSTTYALSDELTLRYQFKDGRYPIERWDELDEAVRRFVRLLMAD